MGLRAVSGAILLIPVGLMAYSISLSVVRHSADGRQISHEPDPPTHDLAQGGEVYMPAPADLHSVQRQNTKVYLHRPMNPATVTVATTPRPDQVTNAVALDKLSWRVRGF